MLERQNADFIGRDGEPVQRDVPGPAVRDDQLAHVPLYAPADERVRGEVIDGRLDRRCGVERSSRALLQKLLQRALDVAQRAARADYRCHGFG